MLRPSDDFELPVFDVPMQDPPALVPYEQAVAAFEEIIVAYKLRDEPRPIENIPEFKL